MKKLVTPFRVGLLTLAALASFAYLFGNVREGIDEGGYEVYAVFDDASGLLVKSRVQIAGINVGQIERIELLGEKAKVVLQVTVPLYQDAKVVKRQASMLGDYYLALVPGSKQPALKHGDAIPTVLGGSGVNEVFDNLQVITQDISAVTRSLRSVMGGEQGEQLLRTVAQNLAQTTEAIRESVIGNQDAVARTLANLEKITSDLSGISASGGNDLAQILAETRQIIHQVNSLLAEHKDEIGDSMGSLRLALEKANKGLDEMDTALTHVKSITEKVDRGEGTLGKLINDGEIHEEMTGLVGDVNDLVSSYTGLKTIVGLRSEYSFYDNSMKNYVSVRLQPRADKYYLLEVIDDPRGKTKITQRTTRTWDPSATPLVQSEEVETTDELKISLQMAKRYHFLTGRFGIIEGTGGLGVDVNLLHDNLELSCDLFDFGLDLNPRLKLMGNYQFFSHLYFLGGMDDALNANGRDYFFGAAIRFTDDDLKALITAAPMPKF